MAPAPTRILLVGAGAVAQTWVEAVRRTPGARIAAVVDPHLEAAAALAESQGCHAFAGLEETAGVAEVAIVASPPASHEPLTTRLLAAGCDVLCEKPLALDLAAARRMTGAAREHGRLLVMSSKFRYAADVVRARSLIAGGAIGEPVLYQGAFTARLDMARRWNSDPATSGGGVLIDNGCHAADLLRFLIGPVREVLAVEAPRVAGLAVEETVHLMARAGAGTLAGIDLSWSVHAPLEHYALVLGTHGTLALGWEGSRYRAAGASAWTPFGSGYRKLEVFADQLADVLAAREQGREARVGTADALASVAVCDAAYASLRSRAWTPVAADD